MKKWKKYALSGVCATMAMTACFAFAACGRNSGVKNQFVVDDGDTRTVSGKAGESITFPEVEKEGFIFKGWYISPDYTGMPVTSATFDGETVYYARWAQGYEVKLNLDGGSVSGYDASKKIYLEAGASIADFMKDYIPANGEYQFGGWYANGALVGANDRMPASGIELVARYKAQYTVNVHVQNIEDTGYTVNESLKITDYALIGDSYTPEVNLTGLTKTAHDDEVTTKTIGKNKSENVYEYYFTRNDVTLTLNSNYPNGSPEIEVYDYLYGQTIALPANTFSANGCRFLGWVTSMDATYADVLTGDYTLGENEVLYAVWNVAYTDALNGEDLIYPVFNIDESGALLLDTGKITLARGGVDIESSAYNANTGIYTVSGEEIDISVKLNADGTFLYYSNREGTYYLWENNSPVATSTIVLDKANGITYTSTAEGNAFSKTGFYTIGADGLYTATVSEDGGAAETLVFKTDVAQTNAGYVLVFLKRGEEYNYGIPKEELDLESDDGYKFMFRISNGQGYYYPGISLDGFGSGYAAFPSSYGDGDVTVELTYTLTNGVLSFEIPAASVTYTAKLVDYNGDTMYAFYEPGLDKTFTNEGNGATLTLDGMGNATYTKGNESTTGAYQSTEGSRYNYIIEMASGDIYLIRGDTFIEAAGSYMDYRYLNEETLNIGLPIIAIEGAKGTLYGQKNVNDADFSVISTGTIAYDGVKYVYTVTSKIESWAETKYTEITFMVESVRTKSNTYANIYYILSYKTADEEQQLATVYTNGDETLTVTEMFAVYEDGNGLVLAGMYEVFEATNAIIIEGEEENYAFELNDENATFIMLAQEPLPLQRLLSATELSTTDILTLTGKVSDEGIEEAIYTDGNDTWKGTINTEPTKLSNGGLSASFFTFTGTNASGQTKTIYFNYSYGVTTNDEGERVIVYFFVEFTDNDNPPASIGAMATNGDTSSSDMIALLTNGKLVYRANGAADVEGTISTDEDYWVFDEQPLTVYTFTPVSGNAFRFTILQMNNAVYFMIAEEGENLTYTTGDSTLILDSVAHIAKYIDADGAEYITNYFVEENVLNDQPAYSIYANGRVYVFDIAQNGTAFTIRGEEGAMYLVAYNQDLNGMTLNLDGYGNAVYADMETEQGVNGTYTVADGIITVTIDGKSFTGTTGSITIGNYTYNAFLMEEAGFAGNYLNTKDLSVLVLDAFGNAVKYDSYGTKTEGMYRILDDGLFFFADYGATDIGVYTFGANNTIVAENYVNTYYAYDLSAIVLENGLASVDGEVMFYHYDVQTNKITLYRPATEKDDTFNDYGFVSEEFTLGTNGKIMLNGKEYTLGDGDTMFTLNGADGSKVICYPTGDYEFDIAGLFVESGKTDAEGVPCTVSVFYKTVKVEGKEEEEQKLVVIVALESKHHIKGSLEEYSFSDEYTLTFNADTKEYTLGEPETNIVAIDVSIDESGQPQAGQVGYLFIIKNGDDFTVTGRLFGIGLYFEKGILSYASIGSLSGNFGNLFTCEFTSEDAPGYTFHLSFYLIPSSGMHLFYIDMLTMTQNASEDYLPVGGSADTVVYWGTVVYGEGKFYPVLKYKGEIIPIYDYAMDDKVFMLSTIKYNVNSHEIFYYDLTYTLEDNGTTIASLDSIRKYTLEIITTGSDTVRAARDAETGKFFDVVVIVTARGNEYVISCVQNPDGTFTATTQAEISEGEFESHTYTVTITQPADGDPTVTVVEVTA